MKIRKIKENKKQFLSLLLLADEQENMIQYCIKSELAYSKLYEVADGLQTVEYTEFNEKYNQRDITARQKMRELVDSDANRVTKVFSTLFEE